MSSKRPYITKVRAKSDLSGTGVTEDLARQMCKSKGKTYMAIVEVVVDELHDKLSGQEAADLVITQFWPATETELEDHLRELTRTLHQNKALASEDETLDIENKDDLAPKVSDVLAAGEKLKPHTFDPSPDNPDLCTCGKDDYADVHQNASELVDA